MKPECLFIATMATGIVYCDKSREEAGDYVRLCFLPFSTLQPEWSTIKMSPAIRETIEKEVLSMQIRSGEIYQTSTSGHTVLLGDRAEAGLALTSLLKKFPKLPVRENCLENMACPICGSRERFQIRMEVTMTLHDNGVDGDYRDTEWGENSYCQCFQCKHEGIADNFTFPGLDDFLREAKKVTAALP